MEPTKKPWQSKTLVVNFLMAAGVLLYPPLSEWISAHPSELASAWAVLGILLRLVTKEKISLSE